MEADAEILSGLIRVWVRSVDYSVPYVFTVTFSATLGHAVLKGAMSPHVESIADKVAVARAVFRELKRIGIKTWEWERKARSQAEASLALELPSNPPVLDSLRLPS